MKIGFILVAFASGLYFGWVFGSNRSESGRFQNLNNLDDNFTILTMLDTKEGNVWLLKTNLDWFKINTPLGHTKGTP